MKSMWVSWEKYVGDSDESSVCSGFSLKRENKILFKTEMKSQSPGHFNTHFQK